MLTSSQRCIQPASFSTPIRLSCCRLAYALPSRNGPLNARFRSCIRVRCETLKSEAKKQEKPRGPWQGYKAYSTLLRRAWTLGPLVLWKIVVVGIQALRQACRVVIEALRRGYLDSALQLCAVLIQQQDTDVLLETTQGMTEVGGQEEADKLKQALTGQGYQLGWFFGKLASKPVPQNREEAVQAAKDVVNTTSSAIKGAVAGVAESVKPKSRRELEEGLT